MRTRWTLIGATLLMAVPAAGYYHFTRYATRFGSSPAIYEKFDVNALPEKSVRYLLNDEARPLTATGDSFASVLSQIHLAASAWNGVSTSELRLAFGGMTNARVSMSSPSIEVGFSDEVPPGIIAMGGPVTRGDQVYGTQGTFVPIWKSLVLLRRDLRDRPSYSEKFFLTVVHEFGHAIGLQHTWSSSVMSTEITRATTKAQPLGADDVAGISLLYPTASFTSTFGAVSGRVTSGGAGVPLASVVALAPGRGAVSTLTNPDGTYRLEGIAPGSYYIYVQPLPPALAGEPQPVNLVLPTDPQGSIPPPSNFDLLFYPGTRQPSLTVNVNAGQTVDGINFGVTPRAAARLHSVTAYSFFGPEAVKPASMVMSAGRGTMVLTGVGLITGSAATQGLQIGVVGGPESIVPGSARAYGGNPPPYLAVDVNLQNGFTPGPRHLIFSVGDETYVLPGALNTIPQSPPNIFAVTPNADRTVTVMGAQIGPSTRILFDGAVANVKSAEEGSMVVLPPPAERGQRAVVAAMNVDGSSSLFLQSSAPPTYTYEALETSQAFFSPSSLPAGVDTVVEVSGVSGLLATGSLKLSLGSPDVVVRRVWALPGDRALAEVSVVSSAPAGLLPLTTSAGLYQSVQPFGLQVLPAGRTPYVQLPASGPITAAAGSVFAVQVVNTSPIANSTNTTVVLGDRPLQVASLFSGQLTLSLPAGFPAGPAILRVSPAGEAALPILVVVEPQPPQVLTVQNLSGQTVNPANTLRTGEAFLAGVYGLVENGSMVQSSRIRVFSTVGADTIEHPIVSAVPMPGQPGVAQLTISLSLTTPAGSSIPLQVSLDGKASTPVYLAVRQ